MHLEILRYHILLFANLERRWRATIAENEILRTRRPSQAAQAAHANGVGAPGVLPVIDALLAKKSAAFCPPSRKRAGKNNIFYYY